MGRAQCPLPPERDQAPAPPGGLGDLILTYEALDLAADAGLRISAYTAEPGTASEDGLNLLASWAATLDQAETTQAAGEA